MSNQTTVKSFLNGDPLTLECEIDGSEWKTPPRVNLNNVLKGETNEKL